MNKKTILITGSTDGIGKLAAIKFAKEEHQIYLHGRNADKLANVISEIKKLSGNNQVDGFVADFSDLNTVKKMANDINQKITKLDVLINNAGILKSRNLHNEQGLDIRFVVNYLAPYLLTNELLALLKKESHSRIINLSSAAQETVSHKALTGEQTISLQNSYAQSKLALTMWSFDLAKIQTDITVIAVNPGSLLNTNMVKEAYGKYWSSADKGGNILYEFRVSAPKLSYQYIF